MREKYLDLLEKYNNNDVLDIKTAKELVNSIFDDIQQKKCEDCRHYSSGKQPDGFNWHKCEYNFECKTCFNDYFESKH